MKIQERRFGFQMLDQMFYESLDNYRPEPRHYINLAKAYLPETWRTFSKGVWHHCIARGHVMPTQGWKIHLSATPYNARAVLMSALPVLIEEATTFKFCVDRHMLLMMTGKNWPRGGSGKFITIYPSDETLFRRLLQRLSEVTTGFVGPYILSDKRYAERGIVYYRYGTMRPIEEIKTDGSRITRLVGPNGQAIVDSRPPTFQVPEWLEDPFAGSAEPASEKNTLKQGRYLVKSALAFSNAGGVYLAADRERGIDVVIKEARPNVGASWEGDAIALLQKEYRILQKLLPSGIAAAPHDLFRDWEHWFLVEEYVFGTTLAKIIARESLLVQAAITDSLANRFYDIFRNLFRQIIRGVQQCHSAGVVLGDLSPNNVLVSEDFSRVRLIDFEAAVETDIDPPTNFVTPGFARGGKASAPDERILDDYYAVAAMMLSFAFPVAPFFRLHPQRAAEITSEVCHDAQLPVEVSTAIETVLVKRECVDPLPALLDAVEGNGMVNKQSPKPALDLERLAARREQIARFIIAQGDPNRSDRLYPCDFRAFESNTLALGYGAYGTLMTLHSVGAKVPPNFYEWPHARNISSSAFAPGLMAGMAGFAWAQITLRQFEDAARLLDASERHPLFWRSCGLYEGASGWILCALRLYYETGNEEYLARAARCADGVLQRAKDEHGGLSWPHAGENIHLGLGHGASGVALALLYVAAATGQERFAIAACRALVFDVSHGQKDERSDALSWAYIAGDTSVKLPYYLYGSAGIGAALLRYQRLTGDEQYAEVLEHIYADTDRKYSLGLGKFMGLAGIAGFRLDAFQQTSDPRHLDAVAKAVSGIEMFAMERDTGTAYPSEMLERLSCDYGYGCAGILALYDRIISNKHDEMLLDTYLTPEHGLPKPTNGIPLNALVPQ